MMLGFSFEDGAVAVQSGERELRTIIQGREEIFDFFEQSKIVVER
jgi:hypothetical protein